MIKLHLLEKVMQVVANVSKWAASIKNKKTNKKEVMIEMKQHIRKRRQMKTQMPIEEIVKLQTQPIHPSVLQVVSKAKNMKHWINLIREDNVLYIPSYPVRNQRQALFNRDNVIYIDFSNSRYHRLRNSSLEGYYNKEWYHVKLHSREPTHTSYGYLL